MTRTDDVGHDGAPGNVIVNIMTGGRQVSGRDLNHITDHLPAGNAQSEHGDVQESVGRPQSSDDFWRWFWPEFWSRLAQIVWARIVGVVAAIAMLISLISGTLSLWDRIFGGG